MSTGAESAGERPGRGSRIAYLVSQYPAVNHTFILREIRGLRALGMDVRVASVRAADRPPEKMSPDEVEEAASTFYLRPRGFSGAAAAGLRVLLANPGGFWRGLKLAVRTSQGSLSALVRHLRYLSEAMMTGLWMRGLGISQLHTHFASTPALFAAEAFPIRLSATIHGPDEFNDPIGFVLSKKVAACRLVVAISSYGRSQLMRFSQYRDWHKIAVVRLGVDPAEFSPTPRAPRGESPFTIICVGRLAPAKAQYILLEACAEVIRRGHPILLRLVGDGPDRAGLEEAARPLGSHVIFHGPLSHDRVLELYRDADAFALASFAEGVPVVLMEAMAMEIPCIATAITGIPELIQNEREGLLVPPSDPLALADAIERLIQDPALAHRLARAGREMVLHEYDLTANIRTLREVLSRIV